MRRVKGKKCRNLTEVINKAKEKKRIRRLKQSTGKKRMLNGSEEMRRSEYSTGVVKELNARGVCSTGVIEEMEGCICDEKKRVQA